MKKMSRKALRAEAERLGAVELMKYENHPVKNIYDYENERDRICRMFKCCYYGVAYSAGTYGNIGRIDKIVDSDGEIIDYAFYTA